MIKVTRFNASEFWVNADMIEFIEETPDTVISLANKDKIIVKESAQTIVDAIVEYRRRIFHFYPPVITKEE
ncbi:MAG TPA: flagellar FlbD family protein [Anaerolineae bacterium]|nr:flagellar FlbD family protein [Anaerolineae bacterium]MCB0224107.1 flagellar FlbD family protein [Anaerolineae bacterium]HRV90557.1 flagellar FlbD family protein [Anaerolineae bacterium]